ncbi:MAG: HAD-IIB family hydrolase [Pseudomonadota bacterium]
MSRLLVFTDLDGTLLDHHTYDHSPAAPALERLKAAKTPVVMVSSKTRPEIETLRAALALDDPFIVENGGAIFISLKSGLQVPPRTEIIGGYQVFVLGRRIKEIAPLFDRLARKLPVRALSRMEAAEISALTGLSLHQARAAASREFGEAFILGDRKKEEQLAAEVAALGLRLTRGGRFYHLLGENDKGRATALLAGWYKQSYPDLITIGLGDAPNDQPMLAAVDRAFLVAGPDGAHREVDVPGLTRIPLPGPAGFNQAVQGVMDELEIFPAP